MKIDFTKYSTQESTYCRRLGEFVKSVDLTICYLQFRIVAFFNDYKLQTLTNGGAHVKVGGGDDMAFFIR